MQKYDSKDEEIYYEGMGCKCMARYQGDCACDDVDWTPKEVYELRKRIAELESHNLGLTKTLVEFEQELAIRDLEQQAKGLEEMLDVTDTWSVMNTYAITVDDIYKQMQELREQAAKLKEQGDDN